MKLRAVFSVIAVSVLASCQSEPAGGPLKIEISAAGPVSALQVVNANGQRCWMKSGDRAFRKYRLIPELDTRTGKPRILLLNAGQTGGLPVLVIESDDAPVTIITYGPLTSASLSARINRDIERWSVGDSRCSAKA